MLSYSITTNSISQFHAQDWETRLLNPTRVKKSICSNKRTQNELSKKAQKRLRNSSNFLIYLSKKRDVTINGNFTFKKFSNAFITLKLPSKQMHTHAEIIKGPLNLFLTKLRKNHNLKNYVWKAEIQKNGNIHFHLLIDRCIHFMVIRQYWNSALKHLGYITAYRNVRKNMDFSEYRYWRKVEGCHDEKSIQKGWEYGNKTNWNSPNSTDVKLIRNPQIVSAYISKYLSKNEAEENETGIKADSRNELNGRLWFQSQSLSRLKKIVIPSNSKILSIFKFLQNSKRTFKITGDWFTKVIFRLEDFGEILGDWFKRIILTNAYLSGYPFPCEFHESYYHHNKLIGFNS